MPSTEKNSVTNWSKKVTRSLVRPASISAACSLLSGPSGLSEVCSRYGGTAAAKTTLCSLSSSWRAM